MTSPAARSERDHAPLRDAVATLLPRLTAFSRDLYDHPELGYREFRSVEAFAARLEAAGIAIERGTGGIPTAFTAQLGTRASGPQVAITAEYDALPGVGHGCGHNVIAASSLGAFLALAPLFEARDGADPLPGGVTLVGTPAEEGGGGKELLIQAGAFDAYDAAVMVHPSGRDVAAGPLSAKRQVVATFRGRTAHAAANPHLGRNALDGAVTAYQAIAQLRQHIPTTDRVHGVFLEAGTRPNIVPERAVLEFFLRSPEIDSLLALSERVEAVFHGAALTAGVGVDVVWDAEPIYLPHRLNAPLAERYAANLAGRREVPTRREDTAAVGSSDIGNVSHVLPTIQPFVAIGDPDIPGHSRERADSTLTPDGERAIADSAFGVAATALDVLTDDALREAAWADFHAQGDPVRVGDLVPLAPWPTFPEPVG
ncbi:M20 family metallopeptidase [Litorihabitans aurantiacus]|uniref:Peptidase M20 domain-containing protein 2 n=1 Tax=Litorihabitans aurantiacus TaxID=1930061 RepID=A0AA37UMX8_9MICO|nr:M20 family metallopeptidase [Litorihabitans aurantiacus]GMA30934.1 peptidase M20 [Litorihabitans aurantiacus]